MFKHFQVIMMVLNAFSISNYLYKGNELGLVFSSISFGCFALIYIENAVVEFNKNK